MASTLALWTRRRPLRILADESSASYVAFGRTTRQRSSVVRRENTLMGAPFDPRRLQVIGDVFPVMEGVGTLRKHATCGIFGFEQWSPRLWRRLDQLGRPGRDWCGWTGRASGSASSASQRQISGRRFRRMERKSVQHLQRGGRRLGSLAAGRGARGADPRYVSPRNIGGWNLVSGRKHDRLPIRQPSDLPEIGQRHGEGRTAARRRHQQSTLGLVAGWEIHRLRDNGGTTGYDLWLLPMEGDHKPVPYLQTPFNEGRRPVLTGRTVDGICFE